MTRWVNSESGHNYEWKGDCNVDEHGDDDADDDDDDDERGGVEAAFQNYKTECWETQLAAIFLFNADGCGWAPST